MVEDEDTYAIDRQFLVGSSLLVSPVLEEGASTVDAYFPADLWYNYYTGILCNSYSFSLGSDISRFLKKMNKSRTK